MSINLNTTKMKQLRKPKKDIKAFLNSEDGRIAKKSIKKIALTLIATGIATSGLMQVDKTLASTCSHNVYHSVHSSHDEGHEEGAGWC